MQFVVSPGGRLNGELRVASDKSISHRAVLLSSLACGTSEISNILNGEDVRATIAAVRACGVEVCQEAEKKRLTVMGKANLQAPSADINCGNSGTLMRLFCGIASGWQMNARLIGDASLMRRPMSRVARPLRRMGAEIKTAGDGSPPLVITANGCLRGRAHTLDIASAQVKSALLLAGLQAEGQTRVTEPLPTRDHTERMLEVFAVPVKRDGLTVTVNGGSSLSPARFGVPADISSAAFFMLGAAIAEDSDIMLKEVGVNPTRTGIIEMLRRMGARIEVMNPRNMGAEPVADIRVRGGGLRGIKIGAAEVPAAIDEMPVLFVAAAAATGETVVTGAEELRHKESDRLAAMSGGLTALGVECETSEDGIVIAGRGDKSAVFSGGVVNSQGDHRVAMAFAMAALRAKGDIVVQDCGNVATSYPGFAKQATAAGLRIAVETE